MFPISRNCAFALVTLGFQLVSFAGFAQQSVPEAPEVLPNRNTENVGSEPPARDLPTAHAVPHVDATAPSAAALTTPHPFRIQSADATRRIEIRSMQGVPIARCIGGCVLSLPKGSYKVAFADANGRLVDLEFSVEGPGGVELLDTNEAASSVGLGLGVAGPILVVTGMVLMVTALQDICLVDSCTTKRDDLPRGPLLLGGLAAFTVGAIITPIGWVRYARNRHPRARELPLDWRVAAAPSSDGVFLGLVGRL